VSDTTRNPSTAPPDPARPSRQSRNPEMQAFREALKGLRQDLVDGIGEYRPLPRRPADGRFVRRLPPWIRGIAVWAPHALVGFLGLIAATMTWTDVYGGYGKPLAAVLVTVPVLMTLVRPAAAFWLSLAAALLVSGIGSHLGTWPWQPGTFLAHLVVLTVVAIRTRPRTAAWMWLLTGLYGLGTDLAFSRYPETADIATMQFLSAVVLLLVALWHVRRTAEQEVTAQQTATLQERSRRTLLEERTTIARELHDVVAHHMSVVAIQAEAAPYRVENPPEELERAFATIRENAVAALAELRRILGVVRAEDYEAPDAPQPTLADLDTLIVNVRDTGLDVEKTITGSVRELPQGVELSAYRIVQEALSNTLRHAPGARARVEVSYVLGGLGLRIVNGAPPRPDLIKPSPGAGHGITGMRERVSMLGGEMTAGPTDDGGYEVAVFLPVAVSGGGA
jgi:signal transduction histidine kinase